MTTLSLRARSDLEVYPRQDSTDGQVVIKDPISFTHFLFSQEELFLLNLFDGQRTLQQIRQLWQQQFHTRSLSDTQLERIAQRFVRDRLLLVDRLGLGLNLQQEQQHARKQQLTMKLASPLVIRLGGVDPREVLDLLWLPGQILFHPLVILANLLVAALTLLYLVAHFEVIAAQALSMSEFFAPHNLLLFTLVVVVVKVLHELGHALACRRYGGECFEIGVLLLALMPTLYCDVTDAWTFSSRWKRIMVSFAGIYIEILLATLCAVLWLSTPPGLAHSVFFNVVVMCSLNTLLINGNPLLKYDGYYMLSDAVGQPNLTQRAQQQMQQAWQAWLTATPPASRISWPLVAFGLASSVYRWFVVLSITWGVFYLMQQFSLGPLSLGVVGILLASVGYRVVKQRTMQGPRRTAAVRPLRAFSVAALLGLVLAVFWLVPFPAHVYCPFTVEPVAAAVIYAPVDGRLQLSVTAGDQVEANQPLGQLENPELHQQTAAARRRLEHLQGRLQRLNRQLDRDDTVATEIQVLTHEIDKERRQLQLMEQDVASLVLQAPLAGQVHAATEDPAAGLRGEPAPNRLDRDQRGAYVRRGEPLFSIAAPRQRLVCYLGETDVDRLQTGQAVQVLRNHELSSPVAGKLGQIVEVDARLTPDQLQLSELETTLDQEGRLVATETVYRVLIEMDPGMAPVRVGSTGRARIRIANTTWAQRLGRILERWWNRQQL